MRRIRARRHQDIDYHRRVRLAEALILIRELPYLDEVNFWFVMEEHKPLKIRINLPNQRRGYEIVRDITLLYRGSYRFDIALVCHAAGWFNQDEPIHHCVITSFKDALSQCDMCNTD